MSWDVFIFNLKRQVKDIEEIDEDFFVDIGTNADFNDIVRSKFPNMECGEDLWCRVDMQGCEFRYSSGEMDETLNQHLIHLYGADAIYPIVELCKENNWQLFDGALGAFIDLSHPENNGYSNFKAYLDHVLNSK